VGQSDVFAFSLPKESKNEVRKNYGFERNLEAKAAIFNVDKDQLLIQLKERGSFSEIATKFDMTKEEFRNKVKEEKLAKIDEMLSLGQIDLSRAQAMKDFLEQKEGLCHEENMPRHAFRQGYGSQRKTK